MPGPMIEGNELPTLAAPRVALRWLTDSDADALFGIFSNPTVMRYWSTLPMSDIAQARKLVADIQEGFRTRRLLQWGVVRLEDDRVIGTCTLFAIKTAAAAKIKNACNRFRIIGVPFRVLS